MITVLILTLSYHIIILFYGKNTYNTLSCSFQVYDIVTLTTVTILHIRSSELIHCVTKSLHPWSVSFHFPSPPASGNHHSILCFWVPPFFFLIPHINDTVLYLSFSVLVRVLMIKWEQDWTQIILYHNVSVFCILWKEGRKEEALAMNSTS